MNTNWERSRRSWLARNRLALISAAAIAAYAIFVEWVWGWPVLLRQWAEIGVGPVLSALALLRRHLFHPLLSDPRLLPG